MKLNYNIIWVEDKLDTRPYQAIKKEIQQFILNEFFNCDLQEADSFDDFKKLFDDNKTYDLIITDLSLNNGSTGKDVINYIRENKHNHTEIFFYSANSTLRQTDLTNSNRITFYQLTGSDSYRNLAKEIIEIVSLTIAKFQHIVSMRGMIMQETSSLDMQMLEIIKKVIDKSQIDFDELAQQIYDELDTLYKRKSSFVEDCRKSNKFKSLTKDNFVFSAEYKIRTLQQILNALNLEDFSENYKDEINSIRNKFAHAVLIQEGGREYFKDGESGLTFDDDLCRTIRNNIIKHKLNFDNLQNSIAS
jgi:CheY-like chemotaxis protein